VYRCTCISWFSGYFRVHKPLIDVIGVLRVFLPLENKCVRERAMGRCGDWARSWTNSRSGPHAFPQAVQSPPPPTN